MAIYLKQNGDWTEIQKPYIKRDGQWILPEEAYIKENGQWKLIFERFAFDVNTRGIGESQEAFLVNGALNSFEDFQRRPTWQRNL
jgi:hypothetical protein